MSWYAPVILALSYVWHLFVLWLKLIFVTPFQELNMLWILIPIYLGWITAELYQEKRGTSLGNAISNGVIPLWAGVDWLRTTVDDVANGVPFATFDLVLRYFFAGLIVAYGLWIVFAGMRGNDLIKRYGRIRIVTYVVVLFTPIFYRAVPLSVDFILAAILWFPLFYYLIEGIDRFVPDPKSIIEDKQPAPSVIARPTFPTTPRPQPFARPQQAPPQSPYQTTTFPNQPATQNQPSNQGQWPPRTF